MSKMHVRFIVQKLTFEAGKMDPSLLRYVLILPHVQLTSNDSHRSTPTTPSSPLLPLPLPNPHKSLCPPRRPRMHSCSRFKSPPIKTTTPTFDSLSYQSHNLSISSCSKTAHDTIECYDEGYHGNSVCPEQLAPLAPEPVPAP
jgi:hypothetical protein